MKDFNELKQLWHVQQENEGVSYDAILSTIRHTKNKYTSKLLTHVISIIIIVLITLYIFITVPFYTWTTQLSMFIVIICLIYYMIVQIKDYQAINKSENLLNKPEEYISYLTAYKHHRYKLNTRNYKIYTICLSIAIGLYLIEMSFYVSAIALTIFVVATIAWFLICYFILMKIYIKKESDKLEELIGKLGNLKDQFSE
jgi:heme/copper-type cytochrome/quinol oxidase subunit 4